MAEWINVKERLPMNNDAVLACYYNSKLRFSVVHIDRYDGYGRWEELQRDYDTNVWKITHWMPLPEPPKECEPISSIISANRAYQEAIKACIASGKADEILNSDKAKALTESSLQVIKLLKEQQDLLMGFIKTYQEKENSYDQPDK